jgi:rubrerythrin
MHLRSIVAAVHLKFMADTGDSLWTCKNCNCGWTNTSSDAACHRCGASATPGYDGYGFRL